MTTIKDVAKASGYSNAMVSYALNKNKSIKPETRDKILKVATELGYVPNSAAVALRSKKTNMIGLILRDLFNPTFALLAYSMEHILSKYGYQLLVFTTYGKKELNKSIMEFYGGGRLDGLIYSIIALDKESTALLKNYKNTVVLSISEVSNVEYGAYRATEHLLSLGHTNVTHIASPVNHPNSVHMLKGFQRALKVYRIPFHADRVEYRGYDMDGGGKAAEKLINKFSTPISIFVSNDYSAFGVMKYLRKARLTVPDDVSLVGWDNIPFSEAVGLTTMGFSLQAVATNSVHQLLSVIEPKKEFPKIKVAAYELIVRESCGSKLYHNVKGESK